MNQDSSCWIHVNQPWGGAGYGGTNLPRIGQEVIVDFLSGDPDRPVITGPGVHEPPEDPLRAPAAQDPERLEEQLDGQTTGGYNEIMFEDAAGRSSCASRPRRTCTSWSRTTRT